MGFLSMYVWLNKTSFTAFCLLPSALCLLLSHVCGCGTGCDRANDGSGVKTLPDGTHKTGQGALRTTRSISEPSAGAPPNRDACTLVPITIKSASISAASLTISA